MRTNVVLTLTGRDRVGIVEELTGSLLELDGNVETSRMARLGGEFAVLMLVSLPSEHLGRLDESFVALTDQGYLVSVRPTDVAAAAAQPGWLSRQIEVRGADHEGIVHEIARSLARKGVNIEAMETSTTQAPISGTPLFMMTARIAVPPTLSNQNWEADLLEVARQLNVELEVTA